MYLLLSRYLKPLDEVDRFVVEHRAFLDEHYRSGELILSGPMEPREGGVIVANSMPRTRLDAILAADPFVREALCEYRVIEFRAARRHEALAGLVALE
ncbi:MAG TPA: YciI family protein [Candidatus Dormibacteraeota bacterium]|nr:YciI family protein [Candidatus Dormibacteraeota bacterium]